MHNTPDLAFGGNGKKQLTEEQKELANLRRKLANAEIERDILKKAVGFSAGGGRQEIYQFMKDYRKEFPVGKMRKVFKVSRSSFYEALKYLPSNRDNENRMLV